MVENNDIGKKVRRYFINLEKNKYPKNYPDALRMLADKFEENERLGLEVEKQKVIVEHERQGKEMAVKALVSKQDDIVFSESFQKPGENDMLVRDVAKMLEQNNVIIAEKSLRRYLIDIHFFTSNSGKGKWELTAKVIDRGLGYYRRRMVLNDYGTEIDSSTVYITGKGYAAIYKGLTGCWKDIFIKCGGKFR